MGNSDLFKQTASSDYFFYYGQLDLADECKADLIQLIAQPKKSMFFFRNYGAGIKACENFPSGLMMQIGITFGIARGVAIRNTQVSDGTDGRPERRIAVSQNSIEYKSDNKGNLDINVYYYLYADLTKKNNTKLNTGAIK